MLFRPGPHTCLRKFTFSCPAYTEVYIHGSFVQGSTACAFRVGRPSFQVLPHSFSSMSTAKIYAVFQTRYVRLAAFSALVPPFNGLPKCLAESPRAHAWPCGRYEDSATSVSSLRCTEVCCVWLGTCPHRCVRKRGRRCCSERSPCALEIYNRTERWLVM